MTEQQLRCTIANNIIAYRKLYGQTQAELAEKLNYSDKSVSKWERAEGMPDVYVLSQIAALYHVSVEEFLRPTPPIRKTPGRVLVAFLSAGLVFLVAAIIYFALRMIVPGLSGAGLSFVFALPAACTVLTVFASLWWGYRYQCLAVSVLVWSLALSVQLATGRSEAHGIFLIAGIMQILCILWYLLQKHLQRTRQHNK